MVVHPEVLQLLSGGSRGRRRGGEEPGSLFALADFAEIIKIQRLEPVVENKVGKVRPDELAEFPAELSGVQEELGPGANHRGNRRGMDRMDKVVEFPAQRGKESELLHVVAGDDHLEELAGGREACGVSRKGI